MEKQRFWDSLLESQTRPLSREARLTPLGANGWLTLEVSRQEVQRLEATLDMALMRRQRAR